MPETTDATAPPRATSLLALVVAWAVVGLPLLWGVRRVVLQSLALFR